MAEQAQVLEELQRRGAAGELNPRQQEIVEELARRFSPEGPVGSQAQPLPLNAQGEPQQALPANMAPPRVSTEPGEIIPMGPGAALQSAIQGGQRLLPRGLSPASLLEADPGQQSNAPATTDNPMPMGPGAALRSYFRGEQKDTEALAPMVGSAIGSVLGGPAGDIAGTTGGYLFNLATGIEKPSLMGALTALAPSLLFNTKGATKQVLGPLAASSKAGKEAQKTAADTLVDTFNAKAQADFDASRALQATFKAQQEAEYASELTSWQAVMDAQKTTKAAAAEKLRLLTGAQREANVGKAAIFAADLPGIPTAADVQASFADAQALAQSYHVPIVLDEVQKVQKLLIRQADSVRKVPGGAPLAAQLEALGSAGADETLSLGDIQTALRLMKAHVRTLNRSTSEYAGTQSRAYGQLIQAMEDGLENLAKSESTPDAFRAVLKLANAQYLKATTHEELTNFLTHDLLTPGPGGVLQFSPQAGLKALETKGNAQLKKYMQQTTFDELGGKTLYELTKETLETMAGKDYAEAEALRALRRTRGPVKPELPAQSASGLPAGPLRQEKVPIDTKPGPLAIGATLGARIGLIGAAGAAGMSGHYIGGAAALGGAALLPQAISQLLMTPWGQKTLLALTREQGPRLTPTMIGFISAATKDLMSPTAPPAP